jgi:DNA-binding beta-propeller fold protein YncE
MATLLGSGTYVYEELADWARLPAGWSFHEVADVAVDAQDRVYVLSRSAHPLIILDRQGQFVGSWGEGLFVRPHGLTFAPDGTLYCADDEAHCVYHCTADGQLLGTIGTPGQPAPRQSGLPFNRPTKVALDPTSGDLYISDGYGNARVHKFTPQGKSLFSWGEYGTEPGQFNLPHSVCTDREGLVYVADRESHRVQVFDARGQYRGQWPNLHRPCGLCIHDGLAYVGQLLTHLAVNADYPHIGACVSVHDLSGRLLARLGGAHAGEGPGEFTAPHGLAVDSHGDIYVGEVSWTAYGSRLSSPHEVRCLRKLVRQS